VLRKLGQASPHQLEYGMQIQAPLNSPHLAYWDTIVTTLFRRNTYFLCKVATRIFFAKFWLVKSMTSQSMAKIGYAQSRMILLTL